MHPWYRGFKGPVSEVPSKTAPAAPTPSTASPNQVQPWDRAGTACLAWGPFSCMLDSSWHNTAHQRGTPPESLKS